MASVPRIGAIASGDRPDCLLWIWETVMVVEYIRYKVPSTDAQAFEKDYATAGDILGMSEHCLSYELSRCVDEPGSYVVRIEWDSVDGHMQGFRHSDVFQRFFAVVRPYVNQIEEMRHYERLSAH